MTNSAGPDRLRPAVAPTPKRTAGERPADHPPVRRPAIAVQLRRVLLVVVGATFLLALASGAGTIVIDSAVTDLRRLDELAVANERLARHATEATWGLHAFVVSGEPGDLARFERASRSWDEGITAARLLAGDDHALQALVDEQAVQARRWHDEQARPALERRVERSTLASVPGAAGEATADQAPAAGADQPGATPTDRWHQVHDGTAAAIDVHRQDLVHRIDLTQRLVGAGRIGTVGAGAVIGIAALRRIDAEVVAPLDDVTRALDRLTSGDVGARAVPSGAVEVAAVGVVANELADQIERSRRQELAQAEHQRVSSRISRAIREPLEVSPILDAAVREIGHALQVDRAVIRGVVVEAPGKGRLGPVLTVWERPGGSPAVPASHGLRMRSTAPFAASATSGIVDLVSAAFAEGALVWIDDVNTDQRLDDQSRRFLQSGQIRAVVTVPVKTGDAAYLLVVQCRTGPRRWTDQELSLLGEAARDLAVALQHAQLLARERWERTELVDLDRARGSFVDVVATELRAPLAGIAGYTGLLRAGDAGRVSAVQDGMLRVVERNTYRLLHLLDDLHAVASLEHGSIALRPVEVDATAVVRGAVEAVRPTLDERGVSLELDLAEDLPTVRADPDQLARAVRHVLSDALGAAPDDGRLALRARASVEALTVTVTLADGPDRRIDGDDTYAHFFFPAPGPPAPAGGVGLTVARLLVEGHGGSLDVDACPGSATSVVLRLPLDPPRPVGAGTTTRENGSTDR